jgi:putative hydrolase of HD superfamily
MAASPTTTPTKSDFITSLMGFYAVAEKLKCAERDPLLSNGKLESVASHCWMMGLMAMLLIPKMQTPVNLEKVFKLIAVHDLAEAKTGDLPLYKATLNPATKTQKTQDEDRVMGEIQRMLPEGMEDLHQLWREYEANATPEAKFVKGLDKLEATLQSLVYPDIRYWAERYDEVYYSIVLQGWKDKYYAHEPVLMELADALKELTASKMREAGLDPEKYRKAQAH